MPMALCLQGYFFHLMGLPALAAKARNNHAALLKLKDVNVREKQHIAALGAWCEGELEHCCKLLDGILAEYPRDYLALKLSNYLYFYMGDAKNVRDGPRARAAGLGRGHAGLRPPARAARLRAGRVGRVRCRRARGRRATEINPADPWAVHAVAHVMEMQDRAAEGAAWIESLAPHWDTANFFRFHLWWHLALMHWSDGRPEKALALYDSHIWADGSSENLSLCNDISMLARLELAGLDVGKRWDAAAEVVRAQSGGSVLAFVDAHYALALNEVPPLEEARHDRARARSRRPRGCEAAVAWRRKDHARVVSPARACARGTVPSRRQPRPARSVHADPDGCSQQDRRPELLKALRAERAALRPNGALPPQLTAVKE
jgi:hypothetical protein